MHSFKKKASIETNFNPKKVKGEEGGGENEACF